MTLYLLSPTISYQHKIDHRNGSRNKSQWCVSELEERTCFYDNFQLGCIGPEKVSWGILISNNTIIQLGTSQARYAPVKELYLAKFVDADSLGVWHGYPVDHTTSAYDIPSEESLKCWREAGYINNAKMRKIAGGQRWKP